MASELETYLASLRGATTDISEASKRLDDRTQKEALTSAYAQSPELFRSGQGLEAGSMIAGAGGGPQVLLEQMRQQAKSSGQQGPLDPELIKQLGGTPELMANMTPEQQLSTAKALGQRKIQSRSLDLTERSQQRLERGEYGKPEKWFDDPKKGIRAVENQFADLDKTFANVKQALDKGTQPADAIVLNFIARFVAGEKGPLAEGDINRLKGKYAEEDWNKAVQYANSGGKSTLTPEQKSAYKDLVDMTVENYGKYKDDLVGGQLTDALRYEGTLFDTNTGKLSKRADRYAKKFGYEVENIGGDWSMVKKGPTKREVIKNDNDSQSVPGSVRQKANSEEGKVAEDIQGKLDGIKDPQLKQAVMEAVKGRSPEQVQEILKRAGL